MRNLTNPWALSLAVAAACGPQGGPSTSGPEQAADASFEVECEVDDGRFVGLTSEATSVPTVTRLRWSAPAVGVATVVALRPDGRPVRTAPRAFDAAAEALLVGLPPDIETEALVLVEDDAGVWCSSPVAVSTGPLDPTLPALEVTADDPALLDGGFVLLPIIDGTGVWLGALDDAGRIVWWWRVSLPGAPEGTAAFHIEPDPDGGGVLFNTQGHGLDDPGLVGRVGWDGEASVVWSIPGLHNDYALLPDGGLLGLRWVAQDVTDDRSLLGDQVVEITPGGELTVLWDSFDHFTPDLSREYPRNYLRDDPLLEDWTHGNGLGYDAVTDRVLVSLPGLEAVTAFHRGTGAPEYTVSGRVGDLTADRGDLVHQPHSVEPIDGGLLVFNRAEWMTGEICARAAELAIDTANRTAAEVWRYEGPDCQNVPFLGNARRLPSGGTLVSFSSAGVLDVAAPDGSTPWRVRTGLGAAFGFATWMEAL